MKTARTLILEREDLLKDYIKVDSSQIILSFFKNYILKKSEEADLVLFVDKNLNPTIIKSRFSKKTI